MNWFFNRKKATGSQEEHKTKVLQYLNIFGLYNNHKVKKLQPDHEYCHKHYVRIVQKNEPIKMIYEVQDGELHIPVNKEFGIFTNSHDYEVVFAVVTENDDKGNVVALKLTEKNQEEEYVIDLNKSKSFDLNISGCPVKFIYNHSDGTDYLISRPMKFMYEMKDENLCIPINNKGELVFTESNTEQVSMLKYTVTTAKDKSEEEHIVLKMDKKIHHLYPEKIHHLYPDTPHDLDVPAGQNETGQDEEQRIRLIYKKSAEKKYVIIEIPKSTECILEIKKEAPENNILINNKGEIVQRGGHPVKFYQKIKERPKNKFACEIKEIIKETETGNNPIPPGSLFYFYDENLTKQIRFIYYTEVQGEDLHHYLQIIYKTRFMEKDLKLEYKDKDLSISIIDGEIKEAKKDGEINEAKKNPDIKFTVNAQYKDGNIDALVLTEPGQENDGVTLEPGKPNDISVGGKIPLKFYYVHIYCIDEGKNKEE